ncbi:hypothetical protein C8R43DRAFT_450107 [Mycena crocata]|nr:hypothetical protein C8R43DRAFT_450107 [Mycena crocata]
MHPPHPILKRSASQAAEAEARHPSVHFPPSPRLTRTFSAHSPSSYDRSPIVVSPNSCALPARGCPGRTYYPGSGSSAPKTHPAKTAVARGHLHPRALAAYAEDDGRDYDDDEDEDDVEAERTPTRTSPYIPLPVPPPIPNASFASFSSSMAPPSLFNSSTSSFSSAFSASSFTSSAPHYPTYALAPSPYPNTASAPPPLIPDLSSESDESDGFASPPPEPAYSGFVTGMLASYSSTSVTHPTSKAAVRSTRHTPHRTQRTRPRTTPRLRHTPCPRPTPSPRPTLPPTLRILLPQRTRRSPLRKTGSGVHVVPLPAVLPPRPLSTDTAWQGRRRTGTRRRMWTGAMRLRIARAWRLGRVRRVPRA